MLYPVQDNPQLKDENRVVVWVGAGGKNIVHSYTYPEVKTRDRERDIERE